MKTVRVSDAGDLMHVVVHSRGTRWDSATAKKVKKKQRQRAYEIINCRNSIQKLEEMVACNFNSGDYHVVFTLDDKWNTSDYTRLRKYWQLTMGRVRKMRKRRGADGLRYIYVIEGMHGDKRLHIHCLLSASQMDGEGWAELRKAWFYGDVMETKMEDWEHRNHVGRYLSKEPRKFGRKKVGLRIFNASLNCAKPLRYTEQIPDDAVYQVPEGYQVRYSAPVQSEFGTFEFMILTRIGSSIDLTEWI